MDHLDFIRIRGLNSAETEVFQGAAGGGGSVSEGGSEGTATTWEAMPDGVAEMIATYTEEVKSWLQTVEDFVPSEDRSLGSRGVSGLPALPIIPTIFTGAALALTGPAALPAIATVMITQTLMTQAGSQLEEIRHKWDPNSPINLFKKAFLKNGKSILSEAWLQSGDEPSIIQERLTELNDAVKDLRYNDEVVDFGGARLHLRGKIIGT